MKLNRTVWLVRLAGILFLLLVGVGLVTIGQPQPVSAFGSYLTAAETQYPTIVGTAIDSCSLCHGSVYTIRNAYGMAYAANAYSFTAIENLDSDLDGFTNIVEINAHTNPGDPNSHPAVATATPTNTATRTPLPTNTAVAPTNTPTRTPLPTNTAVAPTNTPTRTPLPTNTAVAPTNTPTRTASPTPIGTVIAPTPTMTSTQHVEFRGVVKSLPADPRNGDWVVTTHMMAMPQTLDVIVHVSSTTKIDREDGVTLDVGSQVQVESLLLPDKSVKASEIEVLSGPTLPGKSIEFFDEILSLPGSGSVGIWMVGTYTVNVMSTTHIDNDGRLIKVGDYAQVEGILQQNGSVNARNIEIHHRSSSPPTKKYIKFYGDVTAVPSPSNHVGDWTVNGKTVHVSTTTKIDLDGKTFPTVPFRAEVKGILNTDGSVDAIQIEVDSMTSANSQSSLGRASAVSLSGN